MKAAFVWAATIVLTCAAPVAAQQNADRKADDAAIAKATAEYEAAYSGHDARATAGFYAADGSRRTADGRVVKGRDAVERQLADDFKGRFKGAVVRLDPASEIHYISPTTAILDGSAQLSGVLAPDGQPLPPARYFHTMVLVKQDGAWRILALRNWAAPAR